MINLVRYLIVGFLIAFAAVPAAAQSVLQSFDDKYFSEFAPFTALDMLKRVPGFQTQSGQTERGMGQGGANVLLNGELLIGKGDAAFQQLERINAKNVVKIDILDGATLNIPGLSGQVANIVTKSSDINVNWEWKPQWRTRQKDALGTVKATISGTSGDISYSASLGNYAERTGHWGPEFQSGPDGTLLRTLDERATYHEDTITGSVDITWKPSEDRVGHLNLELIQKNYNQDQFSFINPISDTTHDGLDRFSFAEDQWSAQIDGDYEFPFANGRLKFIGYYKEIHSPVEDRFINFSPVGQKDTHIEYHQDSDEKELIGRTEYSWGSKQGQDWEMALEGVYNSLDLNAELFDFISASTPIDTVESSVEEYRTEVNLTHSRRLNPEWAVQASIGGEYSELSQLSVSRDFWRPKGFVTASYQPDSKTTWRVRLEREVGQLNFFDFIDSVDLKENQNTTGNQQLVPEQSWIGELEYEKRLPAGHTFSAKLFGESISDVVDRIPVIENGNIVSDSIGNIDETAHRYGLELNSTLKGEPFGMKGVELRGYLKLSETSLNDPLTLSDRSFNFENSTSWEIDMRHDIPNTNYAWGAQLFDQGFQPVYSFDRIFDYDYAGTWAHVFVEHKSIFGLKVRADLENLLGFTDDTSRILYDGPRHGGNIALVEEQSRKSDLYFRLSISGTF